MAGSVNFGYFFFLTVLNITDRNSLQPRRWGMQIQVTDDTTPSNNTTWILIKGLANSDINDNSNWQTIASYLATAGLADGIYVEDFGAVANGVTDCTAAIQAAIDFCIASTSIHTLYFRAGNYKISGPLLCYKFNGLGEYTTFNLDLIGEVNANAAVGSRATMITCTHKDTFGLGIQTARSCTVQNILFVGAFSAANKSYTDIVLGDVNDWEQTGVRDERYSPYAGITVDPFGDAIPVDGGYPGLSAYYMPSASGSSGISIRNCYISNFVVGFSISNNGYTPNAESINIYNSRIYLTKVAWSSGQSQTRGCAMNDCAIFSCLVGIDTALYGAGFGSAPVVNNLIVSTAKNVVNILINRGVFSGNDIYAEGIWKIGVITGDKVASFRNCTFKFQYGNSPDYVGAPDTYLGGGGEASFYSCDFTKSGDQNYNPIFSNVTASFYHCNFEGVNPAFCTVNGALNFFDCHTFGKPVTQGSQFIGSGGGFHNYNGLDLRKAGPTTTTSILHKLLPAGLMSANIGSYAVTKISTHQATFTPASTTTIKVGDIIFATAPLPYPFYYQDESQDNSSTIKPNGSPMLGTVESIIAGVVTIKDIPYDLEDDTYLMGNKWGDIYYGGIFGTTTNGSNVITNVYKETSNSLVGLRIYSADPSQYTIGLYVVSEDVNARTLTLSGNMGTSKTSIGLYTAFFVYDIIVASDPSTVNGLFVDKSSVIKSRGEVLSDKIYFAATGGIVGNGTHTPAFKTLDMT